DDPEDHDAAVAAAVALTPADLERRDLRREAVGQAASKVAANQAVRKALLAFQHRFAAEPPEGPEGPRDGAVLDGRDIGTVVCPGADVKFFLTASMEARAQRRHKELLERGEKSIYARVLQDLRERDARDSGRETAPLKAAADALRLDTSEMDADQAFAAAMAEIEKRLKLPGPAT
ncbi:MAG TPA: (d)CMP kinase, partial [Kiloniellaceae bacterium]|nr:(d)CMP kinase [Kiloniellaceae bacterium]